MLPGFRLLLTTVVFAASVLAFAFGAAALLHATHEQFATASTLRNLQTPKSPVEAAAPPPPPPVIALLRVDPPVVVFEAAQEPATGTPAPETNALPGHERAEQQTPIAGQTAAELATGPAQQPEADQSEQPSTTAGIASGAVQLADPKPQSASVSPPGSESSSDPRAALETKAASQTKPSSVTKPLADNEPQPTASSSIAAPVSPAADPASKMAARAETPSSPELAAVKVSPPKSAKRTHMVRRKHHKRSHISRKRRRAMHRIIRQPPPPPPPPPPPAPVFFQLFEPNPYYLHPDQPQTTTTPPPPLPNSGPRG